MTNLCTRICICTFALFALGLTSCGGGSGGGSGFSVRPDSDGGITITPDIPRRFTCRTPAGGGICVMYDISDPIDRTNLARQCHARDNGWTCPSGLYCEQTASGRRSLTSVPNQEICEQHNGRAYRWTRG